MQVMPDIGLLARLRRARIPLARAVVVLFAATWLGLAVQPCVASGTTHHDAATPVHGEGHAGGCGDAGTAPEPPGHDCPHCAHPGDCGTALECDAIGVPAMVGKPAEPPKADFGAWIDLPMQSAPPSPTPARTWAQSIRRPPRAPPRSLQQLFGIFIE